MSYKHNAVRSTTFNAATGTGPTWGPDEGDAVACQVLREGAAGASTVVLEGTNAPHEANSWVTVATLNPATTGAAAVAAHNGSAAYLFWRVRCTAILAGQTVKCFVLKQ